MIERSAKIFLVGLLIVTISSCERQNCKNVVCPIDQTCNNGKCYCYDGYEGNDCQTLSYEKYLNNNRNYFASESCTPMFPVPTTDVFILHNSTRANEIEIYNLMGTYCTPVTAYINTDQNNKGNILTIPDQNCSGNAISGQGTFDELNNRINLQLYYTFSGTSYTCNTILYPQ